MKYERMTGININLNLNILFLAGLSIKKYEMIDKNKIIGPIVNFANVLIGVTSKIILEKAKIG